MMKINTNEMREEMSFSDDGKYGASGKDVSIALGRDGDSMDLLKRHPFDAEISRIPPGRTNTRFHSHSVQWSFTTSLKAKGKFGTQRGKLRSQWETPLYSNLVSLTKS